MLVAHELGKTVDEVEHLTAPELTDWLAFFRLKQKLEEREAKKRSKRNR